MSKKRLLAASIAAALSAGLLAASSFPVYAGDEPDHSAAASTAAAAATSTAPETKKIASKTAEKDFVKVSEDAMLTMRNVHDARLAIFNGLPNQAQTYTDAAMARVQATLKDADKYAASTKAMHRNDTYVPFDESLTVADAFVPTPDKMKHIAKANEHLRKGERKQALEVLKLGDVEVAVGTDLLPVKLAKKQIDQADKLIGEGKLYQANLALKSIEDAVIVESFGIDDLNPKAGAKS
jgi:hypothetical protein